MGPQAPGAHEAEEGAGAERGSSAESGGALGRLSCGEGSAVTASISWGEARDVARCPVMPRVRSPGPGESQGDQEADRTRAGLCPRPLPPPHLSAVGCVIVPPPDPLELRALRLSIAL